jgi:hypothetical protein
MVAAAMGIPTEAIDVTVEGEMDLQGTREYRKKPQSDFRASALLRHPSTAGNARAVKGVAGQNRTILRGDTNAAASAAD